MQGIHKKVCDNKINSAKQPPKATTKFRELLLLFWTEKIVNLYTIKNLYMLFTTELNGVKI